MLLLTLREACPCCLKRWRGSVTICGNSCNPHLGRKLVFHRYDDFMSLSHEAVMPRGEKKMKQKMEQAAWVQSSGMGATVQGHVGAEQDNAQQHRPVRWIRLPEVLRRLSLARSTWYAGIAANRFPRGKKLGPRLVVWLESEIEALPERAHQGQAH
jgi:prophage regulatory protein